MAIYLNGFSDYVRLRQRGAAECCGERGDGDVVLGKL